MVEKKNFGCLSDGRMVQSYTISNKYGEYVTLLDYGATVYQIVVRDRDGRLGDVVLGAPEAKDLESFRFMGSTIGRCANRIAHGRFEADGKVYQLEQNMKGHFLHGASGNYAKKLFQGRIDEAGQSVTFYHKDTGEGGFDCQVDAWITFSFDDEGRLSITYDWTADGLTVLNPTNHTYFNLAGTGDVRSQRLWIIADRRVTRDEEGLPDGGLIPVQGSPADFTGMRSIGEAMDADFIGYFADGKIMYDEFYVTEQKTAQLMAQLSCPETGRTLRVYSDMPSLVLFVPCVGQAVAGKARQTYQGYCAVCLETGFVPNAVNCPQYVSPLFRKGETLHSTTVYEFGRNA
ncbi:MAG: galactose mutarotase [Clostridiales bacterium]|nr:galactose mutarotase [Clostridiales bacterium]